MAVYIETIAIDTAGKGTYEITGKVENIVTRSDIESGVVTVFIQHTSASLIIFENADSSARVDLEEYFDRLVPENSSYFTHVFEGVDDMPSHIRMVLTRTSENIPFDKGKLLLGTWQGIFVFEHRRCRHNRKIVVCVNG